MLPRTGILTHCLVLLLATWLVGCAAGGEAGDEVMVIDTRLLCGERTAAVARAGEEEREITRLTVGAERFELRETVTASGARYEAVGDPATFVWFKGPRATLSVRGEVWPDCAVVAEGIAAPLIARGNEPFWRIDLGERLMFTAEDLRIEGPAPPMHIVQGERRHAGPVDGRMIEIAVSPRICRDSMSGMPFPFSVEATVEGRHYRGCGGEPVTLLTGGDWSVEEIGGAMVDGSEATLGFGEDGRLAGRASCNLFTTSYELSGEALTVGVTATTRMACAPVLMEQERRFLEILQKVRQFDIDETGALVLTDVDGRRILARRQ